MTMHLHHPSLSLTGKRKGKKKFRNAEEARKARELDASWKELDYDLKIPAERSTAHIKSLDTGHKGAVRTADIPRYTGTKIKGIGTMHKSNAVPIFSDEEARDIASMRR
jgi:hypothetical protein